MSENEIREAVARGWCDPANSHKVMDPILAESIVREIVALAAPEHAAPQQVSLGESESDLAADRTADITAEPVAGAAPPSVSPQAPTGRPRSRARRSRGGEVSHTPAAGRVAQNCDCDVNELLKEPIFPHVSKASYIPAGKSGGLVWCDKHYGWVNFEWVNK